MSIINKEQMANLRNLGWWGKKKEKITKSMDWTQQLVDERGITRDDLCEHLVDLLFAVTRADGMKLIALAQREGKFRVCPTSGKLFPPRPAAPPTDDSEQAKAVRYLETEAQSFFLTGSAGTGKSHVLNKMFASQVKKRGKLQVYSTALTGVAASRNVECTTLHSFAGIQTGDGTVEELVKMVSGNQLAMRRWRNCEVLFIDEVSMLDRELLEKLEELARRIRNSNLVFGGIVIVFVGDFCQLPPPVANKQSGFCFESPIWNKIVESRHIELKQVFRTSDSRLVKFLGDLRLGIVDEAIMKELSGRKLSREVNGRAILPTCLFAVNADVDKLNQKRLEELENHIQFVAKDWQQGESSSNNEAFARAPDTLTLAIGAQVMLTRNMPKLGLVNGSRGVVISFERAKRVDEDEDHVSPEVFARRDWHERLPLVQFASRLEPVLIERYEFAEFEGGSSSKLASRWTVPLRLAWALTIHKSQSQTIDMLQVDLSKVFEYGQAYVALSRASSLEGLSISSYSPLRTKLCDPKIKEFYEPLSQQRPPNHMKKPRPTTMEEEGDDVVWLSRSRA